MTKPLTCAHCGKTMGTLIEAKIRKGCVMYCQECNVNLQQQLTAYQLMRAKSGSRELDFLKNMFGVG